MRFPLLCRSFLVPALLSYGAASAAAQPLHGPQSAPAAPRAEVDAPRTGVGAPRLEFEAPDWRDRLRLPVAGPGADGGSEGAGIASRAIGAALPLQPDGARAGASFGSADRRSRARRSAAPGLAQEIDDVDVGNHRTRRTETAPLSPPTLRLGDVEVRPGALVQVTGRVPLARPADAEVFAIPRARLSLRATLAGRIEGFVRADLVDEPALLDADVSYRVASALELRAGRFKTPFSYEYLTSSAGTDFVDRARVVRALVPNRRVGVEAVARRGDVLELTAGVFNGRGPDDDGADASGARGRLLGVGRIDAHLPPALARATGLRASFGANVAAEDGPTPAGTASVGGRATVGVDGRVRRGRALVAAEWIGETTRRAPSGSDDRRGYHVTAAYDIAFDHRLLARLDRFGGSSDLVLGYNASAHAGAAAQLNVVVPLDGRAGSRRAGVAAGVQVSF